MTEPVLSARAIAGLLGRDLPTDEQVAVIESPLRPALVVAGAGSGKTETMAARVVWLLANALVAPEEVLGLTFTRKAAGELAERVRRRLRHLARAAAEQGVHLPGLSAAEDAGGAALLTVARPTVSTYNAYAASLVADHGLRLGVEPSARLLGEAAQWQLASEVVESWTADLDSAAAVSTVVEAVLTLSGALDEHLLDAAGARSGIDAIVDAIEATPPGTPPRAPYAEVKRLVGSLRERQRMLDLVAAYRERKRAADALDFGDQVAIAARLARDVPEVAAGERTRFRVVLLDEYQDTSYAQLVLLAALFGGGHPVTAVGDPHQSIYGWRGASAGGLERFPTDFPDVAPDGDRSPASVYALSTSWRNDVAVLAAANHVAAPLRAPGRTRVALPTLDARPGAGPGQVVAHLAPTLEEEAQAVAEFVADRWRPEGGPGVRGGAPAPGGARVSAAVLCRKRAQFPVLHRALRAAGLPVEVVGLGGLLATPEVVDLVAVLQAAHDPSRGDALMRLLTGARTRLGAADLHALADWSAHLAHGFDARAAAAVARDRAAGAPGEVGADDGSAEASPVVADVVDERSIVDAVDAPPPPGWTSPGGRSLTPGGLERVTAVGEVLRAVRRQTYLSLPELVGHAERLWGLDIEVAARPGVSPGRARAHLDAFREVSVRYADATDDPSLGGFLAWLESADAHEHGLDMPVAEPDPDAVQLITVHAAKGLEWDAVAVAGLVDGGLPATRTQGKDGPTDSAWLTGLGELPYPLRGDRHDLPTLEVAGAVDPKDLEERRKQFLRDAGDHQVAEERRLAYVAFTRARSALLLTGAWWGDGSRVRPPSLFLSEVVDAGLARVAGWAVQPDDGVENPRTQESASVVWPVDPFVVAGEDAPSRRAPVELAADAVRAARAGGTADVPTSWDRTVELLLAEQASESRPRPEVELPAHLSASAVVRLAADGGEFARALRRPVPNRPSPQARRGTQFHAWVEGYFGSPALVDLDDLPGADDDSVPVDADEAALRAAFLATPWASLDPVAVEVDVETTVAGYVLRSRIDAVFPDPDRRDEPGAVVVVDWKTGAPPRDPASAAVRELQLAVYRLAWSRWTGTPLDRVGAAFCYVGAGRTVRPERLLGAEEIERLLLAVTAPA
ncbi:ATP-dependent DNA helicase [Cellulomonas triticagri]|uniref:DNA 3'-5' helicase n=1 Tax=Cellulomonas triticagri TaxID=2483352 RepID=A0A3M2JGQ0_9CELL|nr:ATP-dependent DNA helicase [Cellulomonas triticagri]RMI12992.1 ATP-dependent helicase [Cellulomonas triticagri]